ncbi:hydroxymethylglutaryl-CoA lyase [Alteribacillus persepolensis]|uniref:Hydroxymethylglutaryl-CoA lyase n=1 Tax=Alteribacillus persepolensis TaxID=568899 RepID=A0A1G8DBW1_9BACI|nr:hydroxymethylglutaryl-CoA lyase [Alteribacillus persepolensis]SDH55202.1 hydroxymethylglutaryl-CoA lyase [Alteribacillus persepolensis]
MELPKQITIKEVGPRDGLQNEDAFIPTSQKIKWIHHLAESGLKHVEVTSFVHPKKIPALKDADELTRQLPKKPGVTYSALVPNLKGLERAVACGVSEIAVFMSASETHNKANINKSIKETLPILRQTVKEANRQQIQVRGYISTAFFCPYEGHIEAKAVQMLSETLLEMGIYEVSVGDTVGTASPLHVEETLECLLKRIPRNRLAMHFHDTRGMALSNTLKALEMGITTFDSSCGGLGGCPYAPGAQGNTATEDLLYMCHQMGIHTGISDEKLLQQALYIEKNIGRSLPSKALQVWKQNMAKKGRGN